MTSEPTDPDSQQIADPTDARRLRRFPAAVVLLTLLALAIIWWTSWLDRDVRNFVTPPLLAGSLLLLVGWYLFRGRTAVRRRVTQVLAAAAVVGILALLFRLDGYTGDMQPKIVFRWAPKADQLLEPPPPGPQRSAADDDPADLTETTPHDYPQFLGPARTAVIAGIRLARDWQARPPQLMWRQPIGGGWSAFAVVGDYAVTQEQRGEEELVICYELRTGRVAWSHADLGRFTSVLGNDGPRATPTIYAGKVYAQSPRGPLLCLNGADGALLWSHDIIRENAAENINWGRSGSPLVVDDKVIVSAGGPNGRSLVAYHAETGDVVWAAGDDVASYSSPALATLCGVQQVVVVNQDQVVGHRLTDGKPLWRCPWPGKSNSNPSASQPVAVGDDRVFLSKGYGIGSKLIQLQRTDDGGSSVDVVWKKSTLMKTKLTNVVCRDGYVYGLSQGVLECVELATGQRRWKRGRYGHGQLLLVDDLLLITTETGDVALVEASPKRFRELGRFEALAGKTWNNPALVGDYLLIRNAEEAACYELPLAEPSPTRTTTIGQESR
jgi:outer membrane protein assembly factor BamB